MKKSESRPLVQTTIRLPQPLLERLKIAAVRRKTTLQEIAAEALEAWLKAQGGRS
jgi:hypothetical protein